MHTGRRRKRVVEYNTVSDKVWKRLAKCLIFYLEGRRSELNDYIEALQQAILHSNEKAYKAIQHETEGL